MLLIYLPTQVSTPAHPQAIVGCSKATMERYVEQAHDAHIGPHTCSWIFCNFTHNTNILRHEMSLVENGALNRPVARSPLEFHGAEMAQLFLFVTLSFAQTGCLFRLY